jgi:hypothetical protein
MLNELEATLSDSHRVLSMLEGRERMLAMQKSTIANSVMAFDATSPDFATGHNSHGSFSGQNGTNAEGRNNRSSSSDASDRLVTGSLLALSGLVGYTSYVRRSEVIDVFAEGQSPHQECLPLLCGLER